MKERIRMQIQQPCHENWNNMTPGEQGRHCSLCQKTVVDFSILSDREIMDYISQHAHGDTCGRLSDSQLNRMVERPRERTVSWKYFWSVALGSLLLSYRSVAQQVKPSKSKTVNRGVNPKVNAAPVGITMGKVRFAPPSNQPVYEVHGRVVDETGQPVVGASITLNNTGGEARTNGEGQFVFRTTDIANLEWSVSSIGYKPLSPGKLDTKQVKSLNITDRNQVTVQLGDLILKRQYKELEQVVVIEYGTVGRLHITGMVTTILRDTLVSKVQRKINDLVGSSYVKVYPNPVTAGGSFNVQFNMKETGEYNVQFMDTSGRIVGGKRLMIAETGQVESFFAAAFEGHGAYFIRVINKNGKVYSAKLEVL
ncbi:MAG TPA: carboxypeptidase regulatory-like domain-containing protein [Chitinophagaceae bacterium]